MLIIILYTDVFFFEHKVSEKILFTVLVCAQTNPDQFYKKIY